MEPVSILSTLSSLRKNLSGALLKAVDLWDIPGQIHSDTDYLSDSFIKKQKGKTKIKRNDAEDFILWACSDTDHATFLLMVSQ